MADLTERLLPKVRSHRINGLDLGGELVYPDYSGGSILNLPGTICRMLGVPDFGAPPLHPEILETWGGREARRIVFIVVDALGLMSMKEWLARNPDIIWHRLIDEGSLAPITSIVPSTTTAALLSLWTGVGPGVHGVAGYELWLKEYGVVANMIAHRPANFHGPSLLTGSLAAAGFKPENFVDLPTLGQHLKEHGIHSYALQHASIAHSGLSTMFFKGVEVRPFSSPAEMWVNLRNLLEAKQNERMLAYVYWSDVDTLSHTYSPKDERPPADFELFSLAFERFFYSQVSANARKDTLLVLSADHGQYPVERQPHYELRNHPGLSRRLHIQPTGESRFSYLYIKPGQTEAVREYIERTWRGQFALVEPGFAAEAGLFGDGQMHPRLMERLGDLIMASKGPAYLWGPDADDPLLGRHGSLTPEEMLVPVIGCWM